MKSFRSLLFLLLVISVMFLIDQRGQHEQLGQQERIERATLEISNIIERQLAQIRQQLLQQSRRTFEYLVEVYTDNDIQQHLNDRGGQGWRVIQTRIVFVSDVNDNTGIEVLYIK